MAATSLVFVTIRKLLQVLTSHASGINNLLSISLNNNGTLSHMKCNKLQSFYQQPIILKNFDTPRPLFKVIAQLIVFFSHQLMKTT